MISDKSSCPRAESEPDNKKCDDCDFCQHCPVSRCNMCRAQVKKQKGGERDEEPEGSNAL
ncbi:MAG: hypothetical protein A2042_09520 [Candidatus Schekmanbacteria bacterium GWA2_38_11]|uniref:Uncharacterized protein n=1 Tax=Candidatus Schekmanbacteria bacterium GWA2_38_11 TaxID=1817876 RepID=A0A1F7RMX6_9BACT|nr:MAG: hypothetical protein A2042_09520 [Candidatus Schekmanbacteria bacterium GWA2_38_11]